MNFCLFAQEAGTFCDVVTLLKQYGPLLVVTAFFLWQGWVRENRLCDRIDDLEDEQRKVLMPLIERSADVIAQNTAMLERLEKGFEKRLECPLQRLNQCPEQ